MIRGNAFMLYITIHNMYNTGMISMYEIAIVWLKHVAALCTYVHNLYIAESLVVGKQCTSSATRGHFFGKKI